MYPEFNAEVRFSKCGHVAELQEAKEFGGATTETLKIWNNIESGNRCKL